MMNIKQSILNYIQKIPAFLSGFILGVVLTGAFFLFKINEYLLQLKEGLASYNRIDIIEKKDPAPSSLSQKTKKYKETPSSHTQDKSHITPTENINATDTSKDTKDNISIIEEKIISEKEIEIIHLHSEKDTALASLAEVPTYVRNNTIQIIFKKNPFNNKGYVFENNQLVLYGLQDIPYINIYEYKGELYIKYDKLVFKLPYTHTFQTFVRVNDEQILAKMNY